MFTNRKIFTLLLTVFLGTALHSQIINIKDRAFHFSLEPVFSYTEGTLGEYLFHASADDDSKKASYLEWDKQLFMYGAKAESSYKRLHFDVLFMSSVSGLNSGQMKDSDWKNLSDYSMKTTYSYGDNRAEENCSTEACLYFDIYRTDSVTFSPAVQFQYDYDSFMCEESEGYKTDGKHWWYDESAVHYPYYDSSGKKHKLAPIGYYRHSLYTWIGFKINAKINRRLSFNLGAFASPAAYFYSMDTHYSQDRETKELYGKHNRQIQTAYFPSVKLEGEIDFSLTTLLDFTLNASGLFSFRINRGTWFSDYFAGIKQDDYYDVGQDSGSDMQYFKIRAGLKFNLL